MQLVEHELEPDLRGLVLDDEEQLVVRVGTGMLRCQQRVEAEVLGVAETVAQVEVGVLGPTGATRPAGPACLAGRPGHVVTRFTVRLTSAAPAAATAPTLAGKRRWAAARLRASA